MQAEFVRARPWEAAAFCRITLQMAHGHDPWADGILARPWSPASLREYAYLLDVFVRFENYFVVVSGRKAGVVSLTHKPAFIYVYGLGLLPEFQRHGPGKQLTEFVRRAAAARGVKAIVGTAAAVNRPLHAMMRAVGGRPLGLSTTTLELDGIEPTALDDSALAEPVTPAEAAEAWRRWRIHEVERLAGPDPDAAPVAAQLLERLPRGRSLICRAGGREIGFASVRRLARTCEAALFSEAEFWPAAATARLVAAVERHEHARVGRLTVSQSHARALDKSAEGVMKYQRRREQERHFVYFRVT